MSDSEQKTERGDAMDDAPSSVNEAHQQQPAAAATTQEPPQSPTKELKDGGYGWVVVIAAALLNFHTWGLNSSYAVFLAYYLRNQTIQGASSLGFAFVGGLSIGIATALVGLKGFGTRKTIWLGTVFETMGLIFVASVPVPSQWFTKKRSLANACAAAGSGFGGLTYSLGTNAMISSIGLDWTFRVLAIICFVVNCVCGFLVRDRNKAVGSVHIALNWQLLRRPSYLFYLAWMSLSLIPYTALIFSIVDYSQYVGLSASHASLVGALLNLSQGLGRPIIGVSSDAVGRLNVAGFCTAFVGVLCLVLWVFSFTLATCVVFALLAGSCAGVIWATAAPVLAEVVGLQLLPSALSLTWVVLVLPATFAEVIVLEIRGRSYRGAQLFIGFMYLAAFVFIWLLRAWKVRELDELARLDGGGSGSSKEQREHALRDDDYAAHEIRRESSRAERASIASKAKEGLSIAKGLFAWRKV
ncbi:hypothetical protein G7054_g5400 [Neopestalotiopsis clavispora]|nr:hypothetical protein G7054_g5400 [Neopestalotiopsis clavispora]